MGLAHQPLTQRMTPVTHALRVVLVDGRAMGRRQQRTDDVARGIERQRVRAGFRRNDRATAERHRVEHLDHARIADRHVETAQPGIEERLFVKSCG